MEGGGRVGFDFEGSLELARMLWALADEVEVEDDARERRYDTAMAKWRGPHADQFVDRRSTERSSRGNVVESLRDGANSWAEAWAVAMDQQNKNNRAARVEEIRADRSWMERNVGDRIMGDDSDDQVPMPEAPATPSPPAFAPTATEIRY